MFVGSTAPPKRPEGPWSLAELLSASSHVSPQLAVARAHVAQADAAIAMARAAFGLRVDLGVSISDTNNPAMAFMGELNAHELDISGGLGDTPWTAHSSANLRASTVLWDGGFRTAQELAAVAGRTAAASQVTGVELAIESRVVALFMSALEARALGLAAEQRRQSTTGALEVSRVRLEAGTGMRSEVLSLEARLESVSEAALVAVSAERLAADSLQVLLGLGRAGSSGFELDFSLASHDARLQLWMDSIDLSHLSELEEVALGNRPDVRALREVIHAREAALGAAELSGGPKLSAYASGWLDGGSPLLEMDRGSGSIGASFDWTLADGGVTSALESAGRAGVRAARAELDVLLQSIQIEVRVATREYELSLARLASARRRDASEHAALVELSDGFEAGTVPLERWLGAEASAAEASAGAAVAALRKSLAGTRLALTLGKSLQSAFETK